MTTEECALDFTGALGRAAGAPAVAALLDALGPWEVKAYPAVGKHPASEYRNAKPHGVQLCFEAEVGDRARAPAAKHSCGAAGRSSEARLRLVHPRGWTGLTRAALGRPAWRTAAASC